MAKAWLSTYSHCATDQPDGFPSKRLHLSGAHCSICKAPTRWVNRLLQGFSELL